MGIRSQESVIKRDAGVPSELFLCTVIPRLAMMSFPCTDTGISLEITELSPIQVERTICRL